MYVMVSPSIMILLELQPCNWIATCMETTVCVIRSIVFVYNPFMSL